jgi:hypothetical protein
MKTPPFLLVWMAGAIAAGAADTPKLAWESPRVIQVEKKYEAVQSAFVGPSTKAGFGAREKELEDFLRSQLTDQELADLAATCGTLPVDEGRWSDFQRHLIWEMTRSFLETGDRESLVTLFSIRPPSLHNYETVDAFLATQDQKIKHPILVLGDAYWKCQAPEARSLLARMIRNESDWR